MPNTINQRQWHDQTKFRAWPDGTVQDADEEPYSYMSDDYFYVWAYDEEGALVAAKELEARHV